MIILKYVGQDADNHSLDVLTGGESLEGLGRALTIISHFAVTGEVRRRAPFSDDARFFFKANREGSLEWLIQFAFDHPGEIALGLGVNGVCALVGLVFKKAVGRQEPAETQQVRALEDQHPGDIDALVEAVEPALKRGHRAIGNTSNQIYIINGNNNNVVVGFDAQSKSYLESDIDAGSSTQDVTIPSLNVNSRYGRAFFSDLGRTIPFTVSREAHGRTVGQLGRALRNYASRRNDTVNIRFERIQSEDGRLKRIKIFDAWHLRSDDL